MIFLQLFYYITYLILGRTLYTDSWKKILFSLAIVLLFLITIDVFITFLFYVILLPDYSGFPQGFIRFLVNFLFEILHTIIFYIFCILWNKKRRKIIPKSIHLTFLFPISQFFLADITAYYVQLEVLQHKIYAFPIVCVFIGYFVSLIADVILIQVILSNSQKERIAAQLDLLNHHAYRELEYYHSISRKVLQMQQIRRDFSNQLQIAYSIFLQGTSESAKEAYSFLAQLESRVETEILPICYCQNMIVNVILEEKAEKAQKAGLSLQVDVAMPEKLSIEMIDLCSVFSNLLDNAIESAACKNGIIKISAYLRSGFCVIEVINSISSNMETLSKYRKDPELHGYGIPILHSIAEKYHGNFQTIIDHGYFIANMKLRCK